LKAVKRDPAIDFLNGPGFSREAWACTACIGKGDQKVQGNSSLGLIKHVATDWHKEACNKLGLEESTVVGALVEDEPAGEQESAELGG
jgi:aconitase A